MDIYNENENPWFTKDRSETVLNRPRRWVEGRSHGSEAKL